MNKLLESERLFCRKLTIDDLEWIYQQGQDPEVVRYIYGGKILTKNEEKERLEERLSYYNLYPGLGVFALHERESGAIIGVCNLNHSKEFEEIQIGYRLQKKSWGKGFATEISRALLAYGFEKMKLKRIIGIVETPNIASKRVLEKVGLKREKVVSLLTYDLDYYAIEVEGWNAQKSY
ncbi:GNAT family N-acetyltransferase [Xanthovirga aplysinae]|uniref:GNAT family N-acetyltransferase n=1 Tax=Xanthovirga aplysinae TaxID=2529853 RepID=UPI0012BC0499|nr:GNAT family N-acetyltransferase [Xanthovirga aplysinae]MTI31033.1 N-acetyltransferase [Xanthovirga aplysinae]